MVDDVEVKLKQHCCAICEKCYSHQRNLYRHLRESHGIFPAPDDGFGFKCLEQRCSFSTMRLEALRSHLRDSHKIDFEKMELSFDNRLEFEKWKDQEEGNSKANFVRERGKQALKNNSFKEYLICHRSGKFLPKGNGKRVLKRQGTRKLGVRCTAEMEIMENETGKLQVLYHKTHYGHSADQEHSILSKHMRNEITARLHDADSIDSVLAEVQDKGDKINHSKLKTLSRKDLHNLLRCCSSPKLQPLSQRDVIIDTSQEKLENTDLEQEEISIYTRR